MFFYLQMNVFNIYVQNGSSTMFALQENTLSFEQQNK